MIATTTLEEFALDFEPVGSWPLVIAVAIGLAAVLVAFPPDRSRTSLGRVLVLVLLRLGTFLALIACMTRPTFVATSKARQHGTLIVLADASESMTVADGPNGRTRWREMEEALAAAAPAARRLVGQGDFEIVTWRFDRELHRTAGNAADPLALGAWARGPSADETAIGAAIDDAVRAASGRHLSGVVVLGDGAQHAYAPRDLPPQAAARRLAESGTPIWSVTFGQHRGSGQGRDAAVVNLAVADTVYLKNALDVAGRVRLEGLGGQEAVVKLLVEADDGRLEEVAQTRVRAVGEAVEEPVRLAWTPRSLGERKLVLRVEPQEGEVVLTNNELSTFVEVIDGGLRVLYLEGALRVEQRFLRRVLAASPDMQVDFQWLDSSRRQRWPVDLGRILAGDQGVFLIGDLDASALRPADLRTILEKVRAGAGIAFLGGLHAFEAGGWAASALGPLVPFEADRLARQPFDEPIRESLHLKGPLTMVPDRAFGSVSILRLPGENADQRQAWEALPPLDGATVIGRLTPTAKPLAVTPDGRPLLVAREFGAGRVLAFAADSTWKWAMQGAAEQHRRFWRQMVLWLAKQDGSEEDRLWLRLAQRRLAPGTPLEFDTGLTQPDGGVPADTALEATLVAPGGQRRGVRLVRKGDAFSGIVAECVEPGDWKLVVRTAAAGAAARERSARFTVFRQDLELANPRANPLLMRQIAEASPGGTRLPEELPAIFEEIAGQPADFETTQQWSFTPWDTWPMFLLLGGCLCLEWFLRKRWGLV